MDRNGEASRGDASLSGGACLMQGCESGSPARSPLLLHVFPSFAVGGAQIRFTSLVNQFGRRWRHAIVAMDGDLSCRERLDPGLDVGFPAFRLSKGDTLRNLQRCRAALRDLAPAVMVTTNWGSIEWAIANLVPLVPHVHVEEGLHPDELSRQHVRRIWTRRLVLRRSIVAVPSYGLERMAIETWRLPRRNVRRIANGVDLKRFRPHLVPRNSQPVVIGTVAALRPEKNIGRLLHAFHILRASVSARLVIVGGGSELPGLQALASQLGIAADVDFSGPTATPEAAYASFDIFALSSDTEQMPLSVLEAMASGLPIVATNVGDVRSMLATTNLPFVVSRNPGAIADALRSLVADPTLRHSVGIANREQVERQNDQARSLAAWAALLDGETLEVTQPSFLDAGSHTSTEKSSWINY